MTTWSVQELLRFLSTDAKIPLSVAMGYAKTLSSAKLMSARAIADLKKGELDDKITDADHRKAIINAAKRVLKKSGGSPTTKRKREDDGDEAPATKGRKGADKSKLDFEKLITEAELDMKKLENVTITTNRAPFMLVFAMVHTILVHELSAASALSLAHSYISLNAISKGRSIGLIPEKRGDDTSLSKMLGGSTQPLIKVMSRDIPVVRQAEEGEYRAIDIKALKDRHAKQEAEGKDLYNIPTYTPEAALGYIQRAFGKNLPLLVGACIICMKTWLEGEGTEEEKEARKAELDKQGYGMYVQARPDVPYGEAGWGKKGDLPLSRILDLRKRSDEEYAQDERGKMSDQDGKQLSMEETVKDVETKPDGSNVENQTKETEGDGNEKSEAVRKARASTKGEKVKQLALEESLGDSETVASSKEKNSPVKRQTRGKGKARQTTLEEKLDT